MADTALKCEQGAGVRMRGEKPVIHIELWPSNLVKVFD